MTFHVWKNGSRYRVGIDGSTDPDDAIRAARRTPECMRVVALTLGFQDSDGLRRGHRSKRFAESAAKELAGIAIPESDAVA